LTLGPTKQASHLKTKIVPLGANMFCDRTAWCPDELLSSVRKRHRFEQVSQRIARKRIGTGRGVSTGRPIDGAQPSEHNHVTSEGVEKSLHVVDYSSLIGLILETPRRLKPKIPASLAQ
jgi:hypothetical protein